MNKAMREEIALEYHQREVARFRRVAANATTPGIKARLMQAEDHARLTAAEGNRASAEVE
jgi:hypothetical protein